MTNKDVLNQIKGIEKIKPYAVDTKAIRRGKANLALMMTLTTADHYDWFIGKFPAHNYFEFYGYRVYRRNVYQPPLTIPQAELERLKGIERELDRVEKKHLYADIHGTSDLRRELVNSVHYLTPLLLASAANLSKKRMHYVGEICNAEDILLPEMDLVKIYSIANPSTDEEDSIEKICMDYNIPDQTFQPVLIDERTHWGMVSCPEPEYPFISEESQSRIIFKDQQRVLGEIKIDEQNKLLTPHTQWVKGQHEHHGVDLTIPFEKPYPLLNMTAIQSKRERLVFLSDNLLLAYKKQCTIDEKIKKQIDKEVAQNNRSTLYGEHNPWNDDFEKMLRTEVQRRTNAESKYIKGNNSSYLDANHFSVQDVTWITARLLYVHTPSYAEPQRRYETLREKGSNSNLLNVCNKVLCQVEIDKSPEKTFEHIRALQLTYTTSNDLPWDSVNDILGPNAIDNLSEVYNTLCDVIEEYQEEDRRIFERIKTKISNAQEFCWSSWFGGEEALADVNWRELRKRDVVYVLTDDSLESFRIALKVLTITKRICNSIRFAAKKKLLDVQTFLNLAKERWNLLPEKLSAKDNTATVFETFNPNASLPKRREYIIDPIISERSITLMYAPPGVGKTWFAMCIALAASHGKPLFSNHKKSWNASQPRRVVYLDSEMTEYSFKKRLKTLNQIYETEHQNLSFKLVGGENINLADEDSEYCDKISQWLNDEAEAGRPVDLLVLDNLSTLTGFNDSAKSWNHLFAWMKSLKEKRNHPCSILVIHHSNKKGDQRGSSAKTATVDNVIKLDKAKERFEEGVAFTVSIDKGRDMEVMPETFTVKLNLSARANTKPTCCAEFNDKKMKLKKEGKNRTEEVRAYLSGEKPLPLKLFAEWVGLDYGYVRQINAEVQKDKKDKKEID